MWSRIDKWLQEDPSGSRCRDLWEYVDELRKWGRQRVFLFELQKGYAKELAYVKEIVGNLYEKPGSQKELLRTLLEEVIITLNRDDRRGQITMRWRGGKLTTIDLSLPRPQPKGVRTDEDTIELLTRLAKFYPDDLIAGILNRQGRKTAYGERFTAQQVGCLRRYRNIPRFRSPKEAPTGELATMDQAAKILGLAPSTIHRWLNDGFIPGEQLTPGAPWRIRITDELRGRFVEETPLGFVTMLEATMRLGVSRQTISQRVKRGELEAVHVRCGRRKGLRIKVIDTHPSLFHDPS